MTQPIITPEAAGSYAEHRAAQEREALRRARMGLAPLPTCDTPRTLTPTVDGWVDQEGVFHVDYERVARETGYAPADVRMYGVSFCRRNPTPTATKPRQR